MSLDLPAPLTRVDLGSEAILGDFTLTLFRVHSSAQPDYPWFEVRVTDDGFWGAAQYDVPVEIEAMEDETPDADRYAADDDLAAAWFDRRFGRRGPAELAVRFLRDYGVRLPR